MDLSQSVNLKDTLLVSGLASVVMALVLFTSWACSSNTRRLADIPTIGPAGILTSYIGAFRYINDAKSMLREGYYKYKGSAFKVANFNRWVVVVSGPQAVEALRQAADNELSFAKATREFLAIDYTAGPNIHTDRYHNQVVRNQLTKNIGILFPNVREEIIQAFDDEIHTTTTDWTKVSAVKTVMQIICRTSNRVFVGLPLCRDPDWIALNIEFTISVAKAAAIINIFPNFLKPIVGRLLTNVETKVQRGMRHMAPIIEDRKQHIDEYGSKWDDKPNDMLSWLMDEASPVEMSTRNLTLRMMMVNFSAIHTSAMSFSHALYHLAAMPHYIQPMREEVEAVVSKEGWNKTAMTRLYKVDSFIKESLRLNGLGLITMVRKAVKDYTFMDGTFIPKDTIVCTATAVHQDEDNYTNPEVFDGFRFVGMEESEGDNGKHQMVSTSLNYIPFGHGKHACPGRFFVANELKVMMAHLVLNYDVKLENEGIRPPNMDFGFACVPNQKAEVLFRKRQS